MYTNKQKERQNDTKTDRHVRQKDSDRTNRQTKKLRVTGEQSDRETYKHITLENIYRYRNELANI